MRFIIFESLSTHERFYSVYPADYKGDPTLMNDGSVGYKILTEVESTYEAEVFLFGKSFADREQAKRVAEGRTNP